MMYNKLIRDKVLENLDQKGIAHKEHTADEAEYTEKLFEKVVEEASELSNDRTIDEFADILEVLEAVKVLKGWNTEDIENVRHKKLEEKGGFTKRIILEES